jgi:predicted porin
MKKSLLALAVLGAFAGAASAQTNVTVYGLVDAAIQRVDVTGGDAVWSMADGNSFFNKNGSRLGFKGSEDLGGGLSAIFALESGFNVDNGSLGQGGRLFGRQAFVGLQGNFGAVKLGRQYTPMFLALDAIDPFATGYAGAINNFIFNAGPGAQGLRMENTINYSLSMGGFSGQIAYGMGEQATSTSDAAELGVGLGYANGPINVQFAYHDANGTPLAPKDAKVAFLGGSFNFGVAKIHAGFQTDKNDVVGLDNRNYMLGVSAPIGKGSLMASYVRGDDRNATNDDLDQYAVGFVYGLSKRTDVYTSYARINDKSATNVDGNIFNVGLQHRF